MMGGLLCFDLVLLYSGLVWVFLLRQASGKHAMSQGLTPDPPASFYLPSAGITNVLP